tara:strand:+ start:19851 stop:20456 length:606 start_codon:yes stop_codon:yes gene_type:complete
MGTRNLTIVKHNEEIKVAQYCQWDGYPDSAGLYILNFLQRLVRPDFIRKLERCSWATTEELVKMDEIIGSIEEHNLTMHSDTWLAVFPAFHRNTGCRILELILGDLPHYGGGPKRMLLQNSFKFGGDKVFCEWAWVIDLDSNQLEVYSSSDGSKGIFEDLDDPVRLTVSWDLDNLPTPEDFMTYFNDLAAEQERVWRANNQ